MNEELALAVEQYRTMPLGRTWLIPVRLDDTALPEWDLGGGRTLSDIEYVDLFGNDFDAKLGSLIRTIQKAMGTPPSSPTDTVPKTKHGDEHQAPEILSSPESNRFSTRNAIYITTVISLIGVLGAPLISGHYQMRAAELENSDIGPLPSTSSFNLSPTPSASPIPPSESPSQNTSNELASVVGCPVDDMSVPEQAIELCVVRWCQDIVPRNQVSVKLKPKVANGSDSAINVSLQDPSPWRLIVSRDVDVSRWSPPTPMADHPISLNLNGETVWGIPPNPDGVAESMDDGLSTFATHWNASTVSAGETLYDPEVKQGDLVFYYPDMDPDPYKAPGLIGLALVENGEIVAYTSTDEWGTRADPNSF